MKIIFIFTIFSILCSCLNTNSESKGHSKDYVLIDFAARLEKDYHKTNNPSEISEVETYHRNHPPGKNLETLPAGGRAEGK